MPNIPNPIVTPAPLLADFVPDDHVPDPENRNLPEVENGPIGRSKTLTSTRISFSRQAA